jgi:hypothetical protein
VPGEKTTTRAAVPAMYGHAESGYSAYPDKTDRASSPVVKPFQDQSDEPFVFNPMPYEPFHMVMPDFIEK